MRPDRPERIGVFGGTFDPVHVGHLHVARSLARALDLDRVIWVPAGRPPHKSGQIVSADRDRTSMLEIALADSPRDEISTIEIERLGPSFTADTLELLQDRLSPAKLTFLMGEDSLRDLPTWREPERTLRYADIAVARRPGVDVNLDALFKALPSARGHVHVVSVDEIAISSSEIRQRAAANLSVSDLVPAGVDEYIRSHGLYRRTRGPRLD